MPLPAPTLDTRTWDELTSEAVSLIPQAAPGWTDHNAHDPGITLIELFAWLAEMQLFQLDHPPDAALRAYLRLVGVVPRPLSVARTVVAVRLPAGAGAGPTLQPGTALLDAAGNPAFESRSRLTPSSAWLELEPDEPGARGRLVTETAGALRDLAGANRDRSRTFRPIGDAPAVGDALRLGFTELPAGPGAVLTLFAWAPSGPGPIGHHRARIAWEYLAAPGDWQPLDVVSDATRALTRSGTVRLRGPAQHPPDSTGRHWIRCRLAAGGYDCPPEVAAIAVNPVIAVHGRTTRAAEPLGVSIGAADRSTFLDSAPVAPGSTRLRVVLPDGTVDAPWTEVAEWDAVGPADRVYQLIPETGEVRFGDGRTGRVPPAGATLTMRRYRVGGGAAGNVPVGTLRAVEGGGPDVVQPFPASGGGAREPVRRAQARALETLRARTRAVTLDDIAKLARRTPGVPVGRAEALAGFHPRWGCIPAAGVVTVVVLPRCGNPPEPAAGFLAAVRRHLRRRRLLGTELHVVGPRYVGVRIIATLHASPAAAATAAQAEAALDRFLDPLVGGEDGCGWPLGRDVYESEVMAVLDGLDGVSYVDGLVIEGDGAASCANLSLCPTELVRSLPHRITVEVAA
jgi:predicted phage baseplate assembly protein